MTIYTGYLCDAHYDGQTLRLVGRNKAARVALNGEQWEQDVILDRSQIADIKVRRPAAWLSWIANGQLAVTATTGRTYRMNFRKKSFGNLDALAAALREPPAQSFPAGWYPDPSGVTRWWDGAAWTEHVHP